MHNVVWGCAEILPKVFMVITSKFCCSSGVRRLIHRPYSGSINKYNGKQKQTIYAEYQTVATTGK